MDKEEWTKKNIDWGVQVIKNMTDFVYSTINKHLGGEGSGYFGHAGRPGEVGGSSSEGGGVFETLPKKDIEGLSVVKVSGKERQQMGMKPWTNAIIEGDKIYVNEDAIRGDVKDLAKDISHEVAHRVWKGLDEKERIRWSKLSKIDPWVVSGRAKQDAEEDFAETYAYFFQDRELLEKRDRNRVRSNFMKRLF